MVPFNFIPVWLHRYEIEVKVCGVFVACVCVCGGGGPLFLFFFTLPCWMFEHNCLDTCCFGCLICICFVFAPVQYN